MNVNAVTIRESISEPVAARQVARLTTPSFQHVLEKAEDTGPDSASCTVKQGDTLWGLCEARLSRSGDMPTAREVSAAVDRVAEANTLANPDLIFVGQRVDLSALDDVAAPKTAPPVQSAQWTGGPPPLVPRNPAAAVPNAEMKATEALASRGIKDAASVVRSILQGKGIATSAVLTSDAMTKSDSPWSQVLDGTARLTSEFGIRKDPFTGRPQHHNGIDIAAETGTAILPCKSGQVVFSGWSAGYGKTVIVRHDDGAETVYSHASKLLVGAGDQVGPDDAIALVGSTGRSTGPHLHFELRKHGRAVDPVPLLARELQVAQAF
jgi:murein DD-endopeptidase MepM/ murein hydrolase activator NlpD